MSRKKRKGPNPLKQIFEKELRAIFKEQPSRAFNYKQLASIIGVKDSQLRIQINSVLNLLKEEKYINQIDAGRFQYNPQSENLVGILEVVASKRGFVVIEGRDKDIVIPNDKMGIALDGDEVEVEITHHKKNGKSEGKVIKVIKRAKTHFVGVLELSQKYGFLIPDSNKIHIDFFVAKDKLNGAKNGQKVIVKMLDWPNPADSPFAEVTEILGYPGSNDAEMLSILSGYGIPIKFNEATVREAEKIPLDLPKEEIGKRRDFRKVTTFTIDPEDAKDFDDAISVKFMDNGDAEIGVHIADVSHYVQPGSAMDEEARKRGNSVYLVDRVVPMIPEHLSNLVCSLRPNEEKFCFSAVFIIDKDGNVKKEWFGKTVIFSDQRFVYEEVQEIIEGKKEHHLKEEVMFLDKIAKIHREIRLGKGALSIETEEIRFKLDEKGFPVGIVKKVSKDAHKLVEEFMLLANKQVARKMGDKKAGEKIAPFVYRVHDTPNEEKLQLFQTFISKFGHQISFKNLQDVSIAMNQLLIAIKDENEFGIVQQMAIRSMAKAVYDTKNVGHYGLHFEFYTHFTSPIRRYADLLVHRILFDELNHKSFEQSGSLGDVCKHISQTERNANEAERDSRKYFQVLYVENEVGQTFEGIVTGITEWGIYIEMIENRCEGMVSLRSIEGDHYHFDEKEYRIVGTRSGVEINLGDKLMVTITKVDVPRRQIDLEIAGELS